MSKFKLLITDLDGTAVVSSYEGMPSSKVKAAVLKAQQKIKVSVATGRTYGLAKNILKDLSIEGPVVINGGSQIMDAKTQQILWEEFIPSPQAQKVIEAYNKHQVDYYLNEKFVSKSAPVKQADHVNILVAVEVKESVAKQIVEQIKNIEGIEVHILTAWTSGKDIHVTSNLATKRHGIEKLITLLGVKKSEVIGIGDSSNDLPLFGAVGFKVAMGNAVDELKAVADYVAPSIEEDGLAHTIEKFILNEN